MFARRVLRTFPQQPAVGPVARIGKDSSRDSLDMTPSNGVQVADQGSKFAVAPLLLVPPTRTKYPPQVRTVNRRHPQPKAHLRIKKSSRPQKYSSLGDLLDHPNDSGRGFVAKLLAPWPVPDGSVSSPSLTSNQALPRAPYRAKLPTDRVGQPSWPPSHPL